MKIGIIGCGNIAETHCKSISKVVTDPKFYLCDVNIERAQNLARSLNSQKIYSRIDDVFAQEMLDTVHILTPVGTHFEIAEKALLAECHIYIEKPVMQTGEEYRKILEIADKGNKVFCAGYSALGMPAVLKARKEIATGKLGRLISVHCDFMCSWPGNVIPYGDSNHWAYLMKGGVLQNMADHPASVVIDALGPHLQHNKIVCKRNVLPNDSHDLLHAAVWNNDQVGSFTLSLGHGSAHRQVQYFLEKGTITVDMGGQLVSVFRNHGPQNFIKKTISGVKFGWDFGMGSVINVFKVMTGSLRSNPGIMNLIKNFYSAIKGEEELLVDHKTSTEVVNVLEQIWDKLEINPR